MNLINNRMIIGASLLMMTFSLSITNVQAQTCPKVPTCSELGYVASSCPSGTAALKCPFDQSKVFCAKDCEGYSLTSCPAHASCSQCWNGKYKKTGCAAGYLASGDNCNANPCTGYPLTSKNVANCESYSECQSGETMKYYCSYCKAGYRASKYDLTNGWHIVACMKNPCYLYTSDSTDADGNVTYHNPYDPIGKFKLTSKSDPNCANDNSYTSCQSGSTIYYACETCVQDYRSARYHQQYMSTTAGKCVRSYYNYDCPSSKGWSTSSSFTGATATETCSVYQNGKYTQQTKYRPTNCSNGYHFDYSTFRCVSN